MLLAGLEGKRADLSCFFCGHDQSACQRVDRAFDGWLFSLPRSSLCIMVDGEEPQSIFFWLNVLPQVLMQTKFSS